jgi:hypothetical protein
MAAITADSLLAHWFRPTAGADGMMRAEAEVRELFARLAVWGAGEAPKTIEWKRVESAPRPPATFGGPFELASDAVLEAVERIGVTREALAPADARLPYIVDRVLRLTHAWRLASERGLEVLPATWPPSAVRGRKFAELPDPFAPIVEIWQSGYLLELDEQTAYLIAPIATLL